MFCDTHCHLFKEYYSNMDEIINKSKENNVNRFIVAGCDNKSNKEVLNLIKKDNIYGCLGIHPEEIETYKESDLDFIKKNLNNKKIIAIGEIGLDYYYTKKNKEKQIALFEKQLKIAEEYNLPVVIHSREATLDTLNSLKKFHLKGVIHSFSGSIETAEEYIKMGFYLGINGVITFKNCNLKDVYRKISLKNIILETDSPYLTPVPYRGKQNYPGNVYTIAEYLSQEFNINIEELEEITNKNIHKIFDI